MNIDDKTNPAIISQMNTTQPLHLTIPLFKFNLSLSNVKLMLSLSPINVTLVLLPLNYILAPL